MDSAALSALSPVDGRYRKGADSLRAVLSEPGLARDLSTRGLATVRARHTCGHRVDELLAIAAAVGSSV